jgi:7,8-dihydropterin-6-yl-methyl-4-(beta-D-ribofuranosyl)aminobenzene 5'-phosphate synthase
MTAMRQLGSLLAIAVTITVPAIAQGHRAKSVDIRILSTMLADVDGIGEWGFAAVVVVDGHRILFDTGAREDTVLINSRALKVDLSNVPDVILSHHHPDHTGGIVALRRDVMQRDPGSLATAHVGQGIFLNRGSTWMERAKRDYEASGGKFIVHDAPVELYPGVWLTGLIPRVFPERNFSPAVTITMPDGSKREDNLPEEMSLVIDTDRGLVVVTGCAHAGIVNVLDYARKTVRNAPVHALIGGIHLYQAGDEKLKWTAGKLREFGVQNILGAHCTGIETTYRLRELLGLSRKTAAVAAVGAEFRLGEEIHPGSISK